MSDNAAVGKEITGNDTTDFNALYREIMGEDKTSEEKKGDESLTLNVGGREITFKTRAELESAISDLANKFTMTTDEINRLRAASQTTTPTPPPPSSGGIDREQLAKKLEKDPVEGLNYMLSHGLFGGKVDDALGTMRAMLAASGRTQQELAIATFRNAHPDMPTDEQSLQALEGIRQALNLPVTVDGLDAAYALAEKRGLIRVPKKEERVEGARQTPAPPAFGRGSGGGVSMTEESLLEKAKTMSASQLGELIRRFGG